MNTVIQAKCQLKDYFIVLTSKLTHIEDAAILRMMDCFGSTDFFERSVFTSRCQNDSIQNKVFDT